MQADSICSYRETSFSGEMDCSIDKALLGTTVEAPALEAVRGAMNVRKRSRNGVGELDFTAGTGLLFGKVLEDRGFENVAADNRFSRRRNSGIRLFNNARHVESPLIIGRRSRHNAISFGVFTGYLLHGKHVAAARPLAGFNKLLGDGNVRINKVIGKDDWGGARNPDLLSRRDRREALKR